MASMNTIWRHCKVCKRQTKHSKQGTNHILHLLITLFTCGAWVFVWGFLLLCDVLTPYHCEECGKAKL